MRDPHALARGLLVREPDDDAAHAELPADLLDRAGENRSQVEGPAHQVPELSLESLALGGAASGLPLARRREGELDVARDGLEEEPVLVVEAARAEERGVRLHLAAHQEREPRDLESVRGLSRHRELLRLDARRDERIVPAEVALLERLGAFRRGPEARSHDVALGVARVPERDRAPRRRADSCERLGVPREHGLELGRGAREPHGLEEDAVELAAQARRLEEARVLERDPDRSPDSEEEVVREVRERRIVPPAGDDETDEALAREEGSDGDPLDPLRGEARPRRRVRVPGHGQAHGPRAGAGLLRPICSSARETRSRDRTSSSTGTSSARPERPARTIA
ncbi:hypothetical protein HY251_18680 [bacterium]|nr:hypothetical protein [bacterium]